MEIKFVFPAFWASDEQRARAFPKEHIQQKPNSKVDKCQLLQQPLSLAMELNWEEKHFAEDCCLLQTLTPSGVHPYTSSWPQVDCRLISRQDLSSVAILIS
ncbi:hypothetical protein GRJ2_000503400 [Grus japonensis]|uniref:Uncharacterized protein n=1 Tax=Grus japonensis TaxID=30415 RepID=A0ABC9W5C1_GRUJA